MKLLSKKTLVVFAVCVLGFLIASATIGCDAKAAKAKQNSSASSKKDQKSKSASKQSADSSAVNVLVAEVKARAFEDWGSYSADLRGIEDAVLTAPYQGGRVNSIKAVGTYVRAGEALCGIDNDKYEAAYEAAKAQVDMTKGDLDRATSNVEKGSIGRSVLDGANLAYQNARMLLATAKRADEDCHCQAPFDGVLVSRTIEKYQIVAPGMPTVRLSRIDHLEAVISIPETEAFSYQEGMKAQFKLLQHPETAFDGQLSSIDRVVDSKSRTVSARIMLANRANLLKPGMVGRVQVLRKTYKIAVVVPSSALLRLQNGISAMVVENGVAHQRLVTVGATTTDSSLVTDGLKAGDNLVVTGAFMVSEGTKVTTESVQ
jgi:membrane fusion protein (multidrug efflux system)